MRDLIVGFLANAAAITAATFALPGIMLTAPNTEGKIVAILVVSVIFGVVNAVVKPFFKFVSAPLVLITLGLFLLVVNAALLLLTSWVAGQFHLGWRVDGFWNAFWGALIVSVVSFVVNAFIGRKREEEHR